MPDNRSNPLPTRRRSLALAATLAVLAGSLIASRPAPSLAAPGTQIAGATPAAATAARTPDWAKNAVFYQIFPERFANGEPRNDPPGSRPWGSPPTVDGFMGGDLQGVTAHLPYLKSLGITALYFNPIFTASTNHKYNTTDYEHVDPQFGGDAAFKAMLDRAHGLGMRVMLDGVFNHTGTASVFFQDVVAKGRASRYWKWYDVHGWPIVEAPKPSYEAWWGFASLPKFQVAANPEVADYVYHVEEKWLRAGIDGWRLDVPNEITSDAFWREFRRRAKAVNPDAYLVGEIWHDAGPWLKGDEFDAVMNYEWRDLVLGFIARRDLTASAFDRGLAALRARDGAEVTQAQFDLLGSHDTERVLTLSAGDPAALRLAVLFQMTYPGAPVVYYGDETGLEGGKDPDCRRAFPWDATRWNLPLWKFYQRAIALRHAHPALRTGTFRELFADDPRGLYAYARDDHHERVLVALNAGVARLHGPLHVGGTFPEGARLTDPVSGRWYRVVHDTVAMDLAPREGMVLVRQPG